MKRRSFLGALGGAAAAWPIPAWAQQSSTRRIGALIIGNADAPAGLVAEESTLAAFDKVVEGLVLNLLLDLQKDEQI